MHAYTYQGMSLATFVNRIVPSFRFLHARWSGGVCKHGVLFLRHAIAAVVVTHAQVVGRKIRTSSRFNASITTIGRLVVVQIILLAS